MFPSKKTTWLNPSTWRGEADQGTQKSKSSDLLISDLRWCWNPSRCRSPKKKTPRPPVISRNGPKLWWEGTLVSSKKSYASIRAIPPAKIIRQQEAGLERKAGGASSWVLTDFVLTLMWNFAGFLRLLIFKHWMLRAGDPSMDSSASANWGSFSLNFTYRAYDHL